MSELTFIYFASFVVGFAFGFLLVWSIIKIMKVFEIK